MKQKYKFYKYLKRITILVPMIAFPIFAVNNSSAGSISLVRFSSNCMSQSISFDLQKDTDSSSINDNLKSKYFVYYKVKVDTAKPVNGGILDIVLNRFVLDERLLDPVFMFACLCGIGKAVIL